jgi:DNA end-binding protein Ku
MGVTIRYPYEVRKEEDYFDDIPNEKVTKDMLDLAKHIVEQKKAHFEPDKFEDRYEEALKDLLKKKQHGDKITPAKTTEPSKVINLMDALRRSAKGDSSRPAERSPARRNTSHAKKATRSTPRHRKAG